MVWLQCVCRGVRAEKGGVWVRCVTFLFMAAFFFSLIVGDSAGFVSATMKTGSETSLTLWTEDSWSSIALQGRKL